ncbi:glycoside hydrolase superfamily [Absidia repens]|uniref:alpha-galactosidase n=1 Tax=Absidia repens TaxID=90262 RepID=A0A1X2IHM2_9FUNG|nr:glycoside hydrolase superfamily [Absidia repens]
MALCTFILLLFLFFNFCSAMIPLGETLKQHKAFIDVSYTIGTQHYRLNSTFDQPTVADSYLTIQRKLLLVNDDTFETEYSIQPQDQVNTMVKLNHFEVIFDTDLTDNSMMAEGFQAWTHTREMDKTSTLPSIQSAVAWITKFDLQGDYNFFKHSGKRGMIHSTGYTYLRDIKDDTILFLGSLSENNGYSYFKSNFNTHRFSIYKDVQGKTLPSSDTLTFSYFATQHHDQSALWQRYSNRLLPTITTTASQQEPPALTGWTSWYNFYEAVTEKDVIDSISGLMNHGYPVELIQIDDGYETAIGDWLDVDAAKFPNGMKFLADEIKERTNNKAIPGIWLAPFAVGVKSKIIKEHPEWLVYQSDGNPLLAGPNWGGFRALDIYHPEVRAYLQRVFDTVIDDWGYKFLKLDFIFAAAILPRQGKSRGELMWDAITLIEELTNKRALLLGCGVTLPALWGRFDYSRVSSDASPWWDHSILRIANVRERVSTYNALVSTLNRWPMNNAMFGSDPDVFFIRSNNNQLTADERYTLVVINNLLGQMALMSDNVALYSAEEHDLYAKTFPKVRVSMNHMSRIGPDVYRLHYTCNDRSYITVTNISPLPYRFLLSSAATTIPSSQHTLPSTAAGNSFNEDNIYFEYSNPLLKTPSNKKKTASTTTNSAVQWINANDNTPLDIRPHQTRTFMLVTDDFAGSTGHIIPGWEIESIDKRGAHRDLTFIKLRHPRVQKGDIQFYFKDLPAATAAANTEAAEGADKLVPKIFIDDKKINEIHYLTDKVNEQSSLFPRMQLDYSL